MNIRTYQPGDEAAQVDIYNEAAADLPNFKPATINDVARRSRDPEFDPAAHFFAEEGGRAVAYATFHKNGRVNYPWQRANSPAVAEPLFERVLQTMRAHGLRKAFAAYRNDWETQKNFFLSHGFQVAREMVNFALELVDMPTRVSAPIAAVSPLRRDDAPAVFALAPQALRVEAPEALERHLFHNPYFTAQSVMVVRDRKSGEPVAAGILIENPQYADVRQVDASMPCFRLGAFGTEGMQTKRINGLFSFLAKNNHEATRLGMALLEHAGLRMERSNTGCFAAQVPSDVPHLLRFYKEQFRRQGSFPVYERAL